MNNILTSEAPVHERLILLFSNIFVSDYKTYQSAETYAQHHQVIRKHSVGNMRDFLSAVLQRPAVLVYLNNDLNTRANINENLAREYLELFTLGEGNYTERDIETLPTCSRGSSDFAKISNLGALRVRPGESVNPISQKYQQCCRQVGEILAQQNGPTHLGEKSRGLSRSQVRITDVETRWMNNILTCCSNINQRINARFLAKKFYRENINTSRGIFKLFASEETQTSENVFAGNGGAIYRRNPRYGPWARYRVKRIRFK